jgi:hypothetical protein
MIGRAGASANGKKYGKSEIRPLIEPHQAVTNTLLNLIPSLSDVVKEVANATLHGLSAPEIDNLLFDAFRARLTERPPPFRGINPPPNVDPVGVKYLHGAPHNRIIST